MLTTLLISFATAQTVPDMPLLHNPSPTVPGLPANRSEPNDSMGAKAVAHARTYLGVAYAWNGRDTKSLPNLDCMGLPFRSFGKVQGRSWRSYSVNPSDLVASGKLGKSVPSLAGVSRAELDTAQLEIGDILYLLTTNEIPDEPLFTSGDVSYWPWHMVMYAGDGQVIHAKPGAEVVVQDVMEVWFERLVVTRL